MIIIIQQRRRRAVSKVCLGAFVKRGARCTGLVHDYGGDSGGDGVDKQLYVHVSCDPGTFKGLRGGKNL